MKIEGMTLGASSLRDIARKQYTRWQNRSRESAMYKAVLFALAKGKCPVCNCDMILSFNHFQNNKPNAATLDHTIPISKTLEHKKYGLEIMCRNCNREKGAS